MVTLGRFIQNRRKELGITARGFAERIAVTPPFVTDIEADRRRPGPEVLARIAEVLIVPLEELTQLDPRIPPEVRAWMADEPRVGQLLRRLRDSPDREAVLRRIEEAMPQESEEKGEA